MLPLIHLLGGLTMFTFIIAVLTLNPLSMLFSGYGLYWLSSKACILQAHYRLQRKEMEKDVDRDNDRN